MGNRTPRHLKPGQHDLKGKKSKMVCPCCDDMINHKEDILKAVDMREAEEQIQDREAGEED